MTDSYITVLEAILKELRRIANALEQRKKATKDFLAKVKTAKSGEWDVD